MNLYIMRHGETEWNKQGLIQGAEDVPLNAYGIELAEKTRDGLKKDGISFDKIFSSPYVRARKTAEVIAEAYELPVVVDNDIREMSFGKYEGIKISELRTNPAYIEINKCFEDPVNYQPQETAESYEEVFGRIRHFLKHTILPLEGKQENVLIVCHGAVIRAFICIIKEMHLSEYWTIHQPNCSINIARVENGTVSMVEENRLYYEHKADAKRGFV